MEICKTTYHPKLFSEQDNCNTMICGQRNFWLSRYKHIVKHINHYRLIIYLYCQFDYYNEIKCPGEIKNGNTKKYLNPVHSQKRKFDFLYSEEYEDDVISKSQK